MARRKKRGPTFSDFSKKDNAQIQHARRRLLERYNIDVTIEEYLQICNFIKKRDRKPGMSEFIEKESTRVSHWLVNLEKWAGKELWVPAVYDKKRKRIATFLPLEAMDDSSQDNPE